jgi:hypothetical protein
VSPRTAELPDREPNLYRGPDCQRGRWVLGRGALKSEGPVALYGVGRPCEGERAADGLCLVAERFDGTGRDRVGRDELVDRVAHAGLERGAR